MRIVFFLLSSFLLVSLSCKHNSTSEPYLSIPVIDLDQESFRQVVVDREEGQYLGHPTTVLLEDGKTILIVYPKGHGKGAIVYKRSTDGGLTWSNRLPIPSSWETSLEVPTIHRVVDADGKKRLLVFSGLYPARLAHSEDDGLTWSELEPVGNWGGIVVMASLIPLNTGKGHYMAMFHDDMRFMTENGEELFAEDRKMNEQALFTLYKTISTDGGMTWSYPEPILGRRDMNLCEPGMIRSPDGKKLAVLLRENSRGTNSQIIFSDDEGTTWTDPKPLPNELTGDRHVLKYAPDGRILAVFRDVPSSGKISPTIGDWVGWVGTWRDLESGGKGQYRIRFRDNRHEWDCCYPGVELLPDSTFVVTTYGHWEENAQPYILSVRITLKELDKKLRNNN